MSGRPLPVASPANNTFRPTKSVTLLCCSHDGKKGYSPNHTASAQNMVKSWHGPSLKN